jgi:hypothetical protein
MKRISNVMSRLNMCMKERKIIAVVLGLFLSVFALGSRDSSGATVYQYTSKPGDYIGAGSSNRYTPANATISISGTDEYLTLFVSTDTEDWSINLAAPTGEKLHPGRFYNAERAPFRTGRAPGLDVSGDGRGCNEVWGTFAINQIATNESGQVTMLDATFTQNCDSPTTPALKGVVKFNARPLSYSFTSDPGDYIGGGIAKSYDGATSTFSLSGSDISLQYSVSGKRDDWTASIAAPSGQRLHAGTYNIARFADNSHAGLDVSGDGRGCNETTGTLTITAITLDNHGNVTGLNASFEQHCEGGAPALRGTIHYYK